MAKVNKIMPGVYQFEAETDPEKIKAAEKKHQEWRELFEMIYSTYNEYGPDSPEHQWSQIQMKKWQMEQRRMRQ